MTTIRLTKPLELPVGWWRALRNRFLVSKCDNREPLVPVFTDGKAKAFGNVLLVGAGPGDPDLLTIKALKALQSADIVLVDWLVSSEIVDLIPANVEQRFVGKRAGHHSMSQHAICELMVEQALLGKNVVRLKGGDPAIFGRTAEEAQALEAAGVAYAVIPGITAASGASAYSGIPLTHRSCAQSVRMLTAHLKDPNQQPDWRELVKSSHSETLVFYMGLARLPAIMEGLMAHGLSEHMPIAVVDKATTPEQKTCIGEVHNISQRVANKQFKGPSLIIIGQVVSKRFAISEHVFDNFFTERIQD